MQNMIDRFVEKERSSEFNPFLPARVMVRINEPVVQKSMFHPAVKLAMVAAGIVGAVACGIVVGSTYSQPSMNEQALVVNDNQIENFSFYYTLGVE